MWLLVAVKVAVLTTAVGGNYPLMDVATRMRMLLVPVDAKIGSAIYRLRGMDSDFDYPLHFEVVGGGGHPVIKIENLPCSKNHSFCEANVILARTLELGRVYDFKVRVRDTRGDTTTVDCTIRPTNSTTPMDTIFPHLPSLVVVPEDTKVGTELEYVIARKNPLNSRHAGLEIRGTMDFGIRQSLASSDTVNGTIFLNTQLDFETQSMYTFSIFAVDAYVEPDKDTRNLAGFMLAVVVQDVQDMPPVFREVPPVTMLNNTLQPDDVILIVKAEDGDKGSPRQLRYGLVSENSPFTPYFHIDDHTGALSLARPLNDLRIITRPQQPILLSVVAEEVKTGLDEPRALSNSVQLALILGELDNNPPYFENDHYVARVKENSPQGTALLFEDPYITEIRDDDLGKSGVFAISLEQNNGTFEISPTVGERRASFVIRVRNNSLLDFEKLRSVHFIIIAREVGPETSLSSSVSVNVYVDDVNDNPPVFMAPEYRVELPENMTENTRVVQVEATDVDTGLFGKLRYTAILGQYNDSLELDPLSGLVTVKTSRHQFDREVAKEFRFNVEIRDMDGAGLRSTVPLIISLLDVNDETPKFERPYYEFVLSHNHINFTTPAVIKAFDKDSEAPNNVVRYEIIAGNYENIFYLNEITGELVIKAPHKLSDKAGRFQDPRPNTIINLTVRAYDMGVPTRWTTAYIRVYQPETGAHNITFIVRGSPIDKEKTREMLSNITGGRVYIQEVHPYVSRLARSDDSGKSTQPAKSVVIATVVYNDNPTVDLSQLEEELQRNASAAVVIQKEKVQEYHRAESALFWILMVLAILIVIIVLLLLLCCICPGCPLFVDPRKMKKVEHHDQGEENIHLVVKGPGPGMETKAVQAEWVGARREAWSADQRAQRHLSWRFSRRNAHPHDHPEYTSEDSHGDYGQYAGPAAAAKIHDDRHSLHSLPVRHQGPAIIYTRELQDLQRHHQHDVYLEDIEGTEYPSGHFVEHHRHIRGSLPTLRNPHPDDDHDTDSIRRHEAERGSDLGRRGEYRRMDIGQDFAYVSARRGGKLHRGVKHYHEDEEETAENREDEEAPENSDSPMTAAQREQFYIREGNAEILRLVTRGRSEDEQEFSQIAPEPQKQQQPPPPPSPLPRPQQQESQQQQQLPQQPQQPAQSLEHEQLGRPMTLVPPQGKEMIMQRFMEDQRNNTAMEGAIDTNAALLSSLQQQDILVRRLIEEETRLNNALLLTEALQRTQQQLAAEQVVETQSLPGQTSMATQTDVDSSTQTEPLHLLRPPRRRARSDNDDSYTEEDPIEDEEYVRYNTPGEAMHGFWVRRHRSKRKREQPRGRRPGAATTSKRHKIKTPIIEETESALEMAERQPSSVGLPADIYGYAENKSSLLRRRTNKAKIATSGGEDSHHRHHHLGNTEDDGEETPTDSLEDKSSRKPTINSDGGVSDKYSNRSSVPKRLSVSLMDIRDGSSETRLATEGSFDPSSTTTSATRHSRRGSWSDKGQRVRHPQGFSSTSATRTEFDSSTDKDDTKRRKKLIKTPYVSSTDNPPPLRQTTSETALDSLSPRSPNRHRRHSSRRQSLSEPGRLEQDISSLAEKHTIASRAKSLGHVNTVGKAPSDMRQGAVSGSNPTKRTSRYMEWYKTKKEQWDKKKAKKDGNKDEKQPNKRSKSNRREANSTVKEAGEAQKKQDGEIKPEEQSLKIVVFDDDMDSGIAMSSLLAAPKKKKNHQLMEKKSIFTIAYDDMQTKQLRPDTGSPPF